MVHHLPSDCKSTDEFVSKRFTLGNGTQTTSSNFLRIQLPK